MKAFFRLTLLFLAGLLLLPNPAAARCISRVVRAECEPLIGVKAVGLLTEVQEDAAALGVSKRALTETARKVIEGEMPRLQVEEDSNRAPQIHILVARLRHEGGASSIHLQVEVRDFAIQGDRLTWKPVWLRSYVIPASAGNPVPGLDKILKEGLTRLAADWRKAYPERSSSCGSTQR